MTLDLTTPGAYVRAPGGNVEGGDIMAPVVRWLSWSINPDNPGGVDPDAWRIARTRWNMAGIVDFPWLHCHSLADIDRLIDTAIRYDSPAIGCNLEDVYTDFTSKGIPLEAVARRLERWPGPVHMATLTWVQNGQGWGALRRVVAALEVFPDEFPAGLEDWRGCVAHAIAEGLPNVTLMFKTKPPNAPEDYPLEKCHSLYTADDITPSRDAWNLWIAPTPCEKLGPVAPDKPWYSVPYLTGAPVGPAKIPRALYPPSRGKGTFKGDDVLAFKRAISRAGRWLPWNPAGWDRTYWENFARGKGTGNIGDSGVRGFQRQQWPNDPDMQTGNLGDTTYQAIRRARVSDPDSPHFREPLLDAPAIKLLEAEAAKHSLPALGPVVKGGTSVLDHDLTHETDGLPRYPAFDDAFVQGVAILAPEDLVVTRRGTSNPGLAFYADGESGLRFWFGHLDTTHDPGVRFRIGDVIGRVGPNPIGGGPHVHVGVNVEQLWGPGREFLHHTDYTHGAPTIREQLST